MKAGNKASLPAILEQIKRLVSRKPAPVVIALDGGSGSGKSTLAARIAKELGAAVIPLDDFFAANIPDPKWDEFTIEEKLRYVFDWSRFREQVLAPLRRGEPARWHAFDFASGLQADGTYGVEEKNKERNPAPVIVIEGAYSSSPALADLVDFAILIDVPLQERHARIAAREEPAFLQQWHARWDEVEDYYFRVVRPESSFDLVIKNH